MKWSWGRVIRTLIFSAIGFGIGLVCSYLFYEFVVVELDLNDSYKMLLLGNAAVFLSIGFAFSDQV
jgi:hypothetical protein